MRLIDADALIDSMSLSDYGAETEALETIAKAPTIDAVEVVRCKDCKYWDKDTLRHTGNDFAEWDEAECEMLVRRDGWRKIDLYTCDDHFCADGERKDNEND